MMALLAFLHIQKPIPYCVIDLDVFTPADTQAVKIVQVVK